MIEMLAACELKHSDMSALANAWTVTKFSLASY